MHVGCINNWYPSPKLVPLKVDKMLRDKLFEHPRLLFSVAVLLMMFGVVMPFLMVIKLVESTFFWNFLSYGSSTLGFLLGIVALAASRIRQKRSDEDLNQYK